MASGPTICQITPSARLSGIKFELMTGEEMELFSSVSILEVNDLVDAKLGLPSTSSQCSACGSTNVKDCDGHFGVIKLPISVYHPYFLPEIVHILNQICPGCKSFRHESRIKRRLIHSVRKKLLRYIRLRLSRLTRKVLSGDLKDDISYLKIRKHIYKEVGAIGKNSGCKYCASSSFEWYPTLKFKISNRDVQGRKGLSILAEVNEKLPKKFQNRSFGELLPKDYWNFVPNYHKQQGLNSNSIFLSPWQVFCLLKQLDLDFINQFVSRRELLFLSCLPVTPNSHRIVETTHAFSDGSRISFDERTKIYKRMVDLGKKLDGVLQHPQLRALTSSFITDRVRECFVSSKLRSHKLLSGDSSSNISGMKWLKEVVLSKRTDHAFRMTMVGDPKVRLDEVGIPYDIARSLFVTEYVSKFNLETLRASQGIHLWRDQKLIFNHKSDLHIGDRIERPLADGDIVLVNRPPSVHQHSLIALSAKILPIDSVVSINPLCCSPLLGDFDGDCLHGYVPQSIHCRVELQELVSLDCQLLNGLDGRNLLSLTHDSLTAAYLLTAKEAFLNKFEIQQLEMFCHHQSPVPAIITGPNLESPLWTGQQLLSMLFPPLVDLYEASRTLHHFKGELLFDPQFLSWLQNKPNSIFYWMSTNYGEKALDYLFSAQEVLCEYLTMRGLTVSLGDVYLTSDSYTRTKMTDEVNFGLQEAADACRATERLLNKFDSSVNAIDDAAGLSLPLRLQKLTCSITRIIQESITAFKNIFSDIQYAILSYIGSNNSMLAMINAGSKGSLLKLVQQGACLGMQFSANEIPFNIPSVLSCEQWNQQKKFHQNRVLDDANGEDVQKHFAVIKASLLDGLNPLECFFHSLSGRANLFSENAQLPGTLSRKLMFYMRDLYVAYDGSVRNVYGEEIVQFCYNFPEKGKFCRVSSEKEASTSIPGGQPVGSWASCSLTETAYGALECPVNPLCPSPLLNLKALLETSTGTTSGVHTASLFLSNKLRRLRYGFEHGALEVKSQLEMILFAEIVTTIKIFYVRKEAHRIGLSPWVIHFYIDKERMSSTRLDMHAVKDQLLRSYEQRAALDDSLPKLFLESKYYLPDDKHEKPGAMNCITVAVEFTDSHILLDILRDLVIPCLLKSLIKGFSEIRKVDILWDDAQKNSNGELFLKVTMSENCSLGKFWSSIQNACLPIMDLIDWNRSHPNDICNISSMFGISASWLFFLRSLKSTALDVGRSVRQEHLNIVADRLFISGEFHGLNKKGLKVQRDYTTTSSPFTFACFSNPASCFIDAAKQDYEDSLRGTIGAISWGKESPTGTGGPFKIIYSGKVCNPKEGESIYSMLQCQDIIRKKMGKPLHVGDICSSKNWDQNCCTQYEGHTDFAFQRKFLAHRNGSYTHIINMESTLRAILLKYPINRYVTAADREILMKALARHPSSDAKIGTGVQDIKVGYSSEHKGSKCFILVRKDGTTEDFSYHKCVAGAAAQVSPECAAIFEKKHQRRFPRNKPIPG
ncbi:DNA-directed RNA polymerase IV subunit 1 [Dendrobium catenatum]|uniref:DNA-directed RNA polymerase IV subunit 1 n=1 Tax=Dendrobium catenatum TaxID=906689 RepID=UPI0009F311A3|nr:DNA-directed RNA polymerase IV subunit 1 [Dendrobium catenatum]XP_028548584.1 DNA-directed RNA polymerase IV subunit 1 [Dendrobium catenatum]